MPSSHKPLKVLQVLPAMDSGGVERGTVEIADALVEAGHESWVLSAGGRLVDALTLNGSQHYQYDIGKKSPLTLLKIKPLRRWLIQQNFDVVHVRSRMPAWITYLALKKIPKANRPKLVSSVHGLHSVSLYSKIMTCGEKVIFVSETAKRYVTDNYPDVDVSKLEVIYRGIDNSEYYPDYQPDEEWKQSWYNTHPQLKDAFTVCLPGRLTRLKGHHDFIEIIKQLRQQYPQVKGVIVGGVDKKRQQYADEIYRTVARNNLQDAIIFAGHRSDLRNIMAVSDAVLSLSNKPESFGRTVLESLSLGVPTYGYAHGGVEEILSAMFPEGKIKKNHIKEAVNKITAMLDNEKNITINTNKQFLLANMKAGVLNLYHEVQRQSC